MLPYFTYTDVDKFFYNEYIKPRIPAEIFDAHVHCNLQEHVEMVPDERWLSDWALECGHVLPCEEVYLCAAELFPNTRYAFAGLPLPIKEADIKGNNKYLAKLIQKGKLITAFMAVRPEWDIKEIEYELIEGDFAGFKPYPDMVTGVKGAEISIFEFFPHEQWELLNRSHKTVMLHLPRKERFADGNNIRELLLARDKYPDVNIIIAHFGRSFCPYFLEEGLRKLGNPEGFYFDTAAVMNPEVYNIAFSEIPIDKILYGTDMPIFFWHGKREWTEKSYINVCREHFYWNINHRSPEEEAQYTIFLYEHMRTILDAIEKHELSEHHKNGIFLNNAKRALGIKSYNLNC